MTRKPFAKLSASEGVLAVLPARSGFLRIVDVWRAAAPQAKEDLARSEAQRPMVEQLIHANFEPVEGAGGAYRYRSEHSDLDMIALVENGRLVRLFKAIAADHASKLLEKYRIIGLPHETPTRRPRSVSR